MPASPEERQILRDLIDAFYRAAGLHGWSGEVNEGVAQVFATMLCSARRCTSALEWVPTPPGGPPSIAWFTKSLGRIAVYKLRDSDLSRTCTLRVINRWQSPLQAAASLDIVTGPIIPCKD